MNKDLANRMKDGYEKITRTFIPCKTYTIIRIDGKAFHTYTKGLETPFDVDFIDHMNQTAQYLCEKVQGCKMAFVASDEISLLLTDFDTNNTDAWFKGNVQKMASVSASIATMQFNKLRGENGYNNMACFDSRVFNISSRNDVINYLMFRQQDTVRNSIQSVGQHYFSHKELEFKGSNDIQEMLFTQRGVNWNDFPVGQKRGRVVVRREVELSNEYGTYKRNKWLIEDAPHFCMDTPLIKEKLPKLR